MSPKLSVNQLVFNKLNLLKLISNYKNFSFNSLINLLIFKNEIKFFYLLNQTRRLIIKKILIEIIDL